MASKPSYTIQSSRGVGGSVTNCRSHVFEWGSKFSGNVHNREYCNPRPFNSLNMADAPSVSKDQCNNGHVETTGLQPRRFHFMCSTALEAGCRTLFVSSTRAPNKGVCIRYVSTRGRRHLRHLVLQSPTGYGLSPIAKFTDGADEANESIIQRHSWPKLIVHKLNPTSIAPQQSNSGRIGLCTPECGSTMDGSSSRARPKKDLGDWCTGQLHPALPRDTAEESLCQSQKRLPTSRVGRRLLA